jgi:hypothetical protein
MGVSERKWVMVDEVSGGIQAEILRGLLESQGIPVWLNQEGAGKAYGITLPALGSGELSDSELDVISDQPDEDLEID